MAWFALSSLLTILFCGGVFYFVRFCPKLTVVNYPEFRPLCTVLIPARNEERNIEACIKSVLAQTYPNLQVIVVDDQSTDRTPTILQNLAQQDSRLIVVPGRPLYQGWTGKNNAIVQGAQFANGTWLLHLDADVTLEPDAVLAAVTSAEHLKADFLTVWPRQIVKTFWEAAVQPVVVAMNVGLSTIQRLWNPPFPEALSAWGPFILVNKAVYDELEGHEAVYDQIAEDYLLYRRFKDHQRKTVMLDGTDLVNVRMYTSLSELWEGWSKNLFPGVLSSYILTFLSAFAIFCFSVQPYINFFWSMFDFTWTRFLISGTIMALLFFTGNLLQPHTTSRFSFLNINPLGGFVFMGTLINSAIRHTLKIGVRWKGRSYS
jgi:chlorobactene glucosyltransferase